MERLLPAPFFVGALSFYWLEYHLLEEAVPQGHRCSVCEKPEASSYSRFLTTSANSFSFFPRFPF